MMKLPSDIHHVLARPGAVMLLEGRRSLPEGMAERLKAVGKRLATDYPEAVFRSGNADGSDTAFAEGVTQVDPSRMEYVLPTKGMGSKRRHSDARVFSLENLAELVELAALTVTASPSSKGLVDAVLGHVTNRRLAARGRYLLRDTLKVAGMPSVGLPAASVGLFFVDLTDPDAGGTGHTIRVCRNMNVPTAYQGVFLH